MKNDRHYQQMTPYLPGATAKLTVTSLMDSQEFPGTSSVYEGVARATGTFDGQPVSGTAWNEQTAR